MSIRFWNRPVINARLERLAILSEELCEAGQIIGKIIRHGHESRHPDGGPTNRELLELELGDIMTILEMMFEAGDIKRTSVLSRVPAKLRKLQLYTHNQESLIEQVIEGYGL
jgi:hypothetical protein